MKEFEVTPQDLPKMELLGTVSSYQPGKLGWTTLGLYIRQGFGRPIVATVEGFTRETEDRSGTLPESAPPRRFSFKFICAGSISRALDWFDDSELTDSLRAMVTHAQGESLHPVDRIANGKAPVGLRQAERLTDAVLWLYPDLVGTNIEAPALTRWKSRVAIAFERDFGIPERTVRNSLTEEETGRAKGNWVRPFLMALRHFDREAWLAEKGENSNERA